MLSILVTLALVTLNPFEQFLKASDAKRKSDLGQIARGLESYYQDKGRYPQNDGLYRIYVTVNGTLTSKNWGDEWSPYMDVLPKDPKPSKKYLYNTTSDGQSYWIYASLDRGDKDPQSCSNKPSCLNVPPIGAPTLCGGQTDYCNYGISSPNQSP